ncbi:MAG: DUF1570 domain-containing protein [Planctomycetota bacterium]|jgi:hypothetical protein|nr:DUF1570 domain-containing protein [Planctomycetota bacterium]
MQRTSFSLLAFTLLATLPNLFLFADEASPSRQPAQVDPRILAEVHKTFGPDFRVHLTPHYRIVYKASESFVSDVATQLERTYATFHSAFTEAGFTLRPYSKRYVCVLFGDYEDFLDYQREERGKEPQQKGGGYYSGKTNRITFFDEHSREHRKRRPISDKTKNLSKTSHEAAHQLAFNTGIQKRGVLQPLWLGEGLASAFEFVKTDQPFGPATENFGLRMSQLGRMQRMGKLMPLPTLVTISGKDRSQVNLGVAYAQGSAFFRFLFQKRPRELRAYLEILAKQRRGPRSSESLLREFESAMGPIKDLEPEWKVFLRQLRSPAPR